METTTDAFLDGRVMLVQPKAGKHRSGSDAVFLAAAASDLSGYILDMGAGAGAVGLMLASANADAKVTLAENDPAMLACAQASIAANIDLATRVSTLNVDLLAPEPERVAAGLQRAAFDHIISNPPYRRAGHSRSEPEKEAAHQISEDALDGWVRTAASALKPRGSVTLIFAADGLMSLLGALDGRFGALTVLGLHPREGAPAERVLVRAIKGRRTPLAILPGLVLHHADGRYTETARTILQGRAGIDMTGDR
ncbi:MAG: methyltransferase [Pseudomonadota bacterium]